MIKPFLTLLGVTASLGFGSLRAQAQAALGTSPYLETFDGLANGLPTGFRIYSGATASSLGTAATLTTAATAWNNTAGAFKNFASADIGSTATSTAQTAATDRALGVRQTGSFGDPGASFVFQVANTTGRTDFALSFKLQSLDAASPRTTTWTVDYGLGAAPTSFTPVATGTVTPTTGGTAFSNTTIPVSFGTALDDNSGLVTIRISTLAASLGGGNRPSSAIDDFSLSWNTPSATTPVLTVTPTTLAFGSQNINAASTPQSYSLSGVNLSGATTVTATGPFTVSKTATGTFGSTLSYAPSELTSATPVYVRFAPTATGPATGSISNASAGATSRPVALTGTGADPNQTVFSFDNCTSTLSDGWSQYSVTGPQVWACTTFGRSATDPTASAANGVQMNGYASGNIPNEDWFISPAFNLSAYNFPLLSFWSRTAFNGPSLQVRVSTTYSGTGDPNAATWTTLNAQLPATGSDVWTQTAGVNLAAYKGAKVYVAFVYTSTSSAAARWTLDDIALTNSATPPAPTLLTDVKSLAFGYAAVGTSATRTLYVSGADLTGPITLTSSDPQFTLSYNGSQFASTLTLPAADVSGATKSVTVRYRPTAAFATFTGTVAVSTPGAAALNVALSGDTYDTNKTLEVVNWNIEWFGSTEAGLGPNDKNLQQANITTVANYLNADVYALAEVVDVARLQNVVTQLSASTGHPYAYMVSDFGSYADNAQDPDYAGDQKLAFVYRTDVVSNPTFMGLLRCSQADNCDAYTAWASGRFPYLMRADVTLDGVTKTVNFIVIHAKANATATSPNDYARRKLGATLLKNLLDTQYAGQNNLIVGDYNDVLSGTIATGVSPAVSSYDVIVKDSATYKSITLPLARAGAQSTVSFATVIDNVIASGPLASYYIPGTAAIRTDAAAQVANYGNTTSDHYPVFSRYSFSTPDLVVSTAGQTVPGGTYNSITVTGTGAGTLQGPVTVLGAVTVQNGGRLDTNCQPLTGAGTFTVAAGGTLGICDAAGLGTSGSTGAVRTTGTRSFSADATYVYTGTSAQATGLGLPSQVRALTSTNTNALTLSQPLAVAQTLTLASSGNLVLNGQALTLLSDASGTALVVNSGSGVVQGTATVQRYLDPSLNAGPGYRHLSAPVANSTVADLSTATFTPVVNPAYNTSTTPGAVQDFPTVYGYDESRLTSTTNNLPVFDKGFYSPASLADPLVVAQGYAVNLAAGQVVDFVGTLNNGDYTKNLTRRDQTANGGWQLLGNPYPSPLDWSQVAETDRPGLNAAVYVYNSTSQYAGRYRSYVNGMGSMGSTGNPVLALGQGFFVQVAQGQTSGSLKLHNSQRVSSFATQASLLRLTADTRPRLSLSLAGANGTADDLIVYAEAGATAGFDAQQDAAKLPNTTGLNLSALTADGQPLSIQALPGLSGRVALRVLVPADGSYSLSAADVQNLPAGTTPVLEDIKTGQRTPLVAGARYTFSVAATDSPDGRFWLNLNAAALATAPSALQAALALYPNPTRERQATLLLPAGTGTGHVQVLDALGRLVRQQALNGSPTTTLQLAGLPAGVYLVRVQAGNEQATRRLTLE
jgi:hypothetical protein